MGTVLRLGTQPVQKLAQEVKERNQLQPENRLWSTLELS